MPGPLAVYDFGSPAQHVSHRVEIAALYRIVQPGDGHAVHASFELRPTFEAVRPGEYKLRIMQGEFGWIDATVVLVHFGDRVVIASRKCPEQFLGLALELIEVGALGKVSNG